MITELASLKINDKISIPGFLKNPARTATIIGFRYYTSRNNGRTSMVADYIFDNGDGQSFDGLDRVLKWRI